MNYTRNSDPTYYTDYPCLGNCGSYALNLKGWYDPENYMEDKYGYVGDWIMEQYEQGSDEWEISDAYCSILINGILEEFDGELRLVNSKEEVKQNEELIAFSTFAIVEEEEPYWDFHFKVLRDGKWSEKNGYCFPHDCDEFDWGDYISDVVYMAHKID